MSLFIILGAGPGIGQAVAKRFGKEGYSIALVSRSESKLKHLVQELKEMKIDASYFVADLSSFESLQSVLKEIEEQCGREDIILYNIAGFHYQNILGLDWSTMVSDLSITIGGFIRLMRTILPHWIERNYGTILVTGGGCWQEGNPNLTTLSVGKAALRNLVQAYQQQLEGSGIHVGLLTINQFVNEEDSIYNPTLIGEEFWKLFKKIQKDGSQEIMY